MDIKQSHVIDARGESGDKPDAVKINLVDVVILVNLHTGVVTVEGADHVEAKEGDNNTLELHACPSFAGAAKRLTDMEWLAGLGEEIAPGIRVGTISDLLGRGGISGLFGAGVRPPTYPGRQ